MKNRPKIIIAVIVLLVLLIPVPIRYKDGGSVHYRAILYDITKYHQLDLESETGYNDGLKIRTLGIPVYNSFDE